MYRYITPSFDLPFPNKCPFSVPHRSMQICGRIPGLADGQAQRCGPEANVATCYSLLWESMELYGIIWNFGEFYGIIWELYGNLWNYTGLYGILVNFMGLYGNYMGIYGIIRDYMEFW